MLPWLAPVPYLHYMCCPCWKKKYIKQTQNKSFVRKLVKWTAMNGKILEILRGNQHPKIQQESIWTWNKIGPTLPKRGGWGVQSPIFHHSMVCAWFAVVVTQSLANPLRDTDALTTVTTNSNNKNNNKYGNSNKSYIYTIIKVWQLSIFLFLCLMLVFFNWKTTLLRLPHSTPVSPFPWVYRRYSTLQSMILQ